MKTKLQEINEYLEFCDVDGKAKICCQKCGYELCDAKENYKNYALKHIGSIMEVPHTRGPEAYNLDVKFEFRQFFCPNCKVLFRSETAREGDPFLEDFTISLPGR